MATTISLGADPFATAGMAPYSVQGDPIVALIAQVNRFAGKTIDTGRCTGSAARTMPGNKLLLVPAMTLEVAIRAAQLVQARYSCVATFDMFSASKEDWVLNAIQGDTVTWANANLHEITMTIAQFGDSLGLSPAAVGITTRDEKLVPKPKLATLASIGFVSLVLGAAIAARRG